jgi:transposase InsO family protein
VRDSVVKYCQHICKNSQLTIAILIVLFGITRHKYYDWAKRFGMQNNHNGKQPKAHWLLPEERNAVIEYAKSHNENSYYLKDGYRRITYKMIDENICYASPATVYRILKKEDLLNRWKGKTTSGKHHGFNQPDAPHKHWHTDIKFVNFRGTFLFFISVIDGYSRYIVHHELRQSMKEQDVEIVIQRAVEKYPSVKPRIISDNGGQYVSADFHNFIKEVGLEHVRTSPAYPQSNGKIERFHRSLSEECLRQSSLINIKDAEEQIAKYIDFYNNERLHSSLHYLRPVDFLNGDVDKLLKIRQDKLDQATANRVKFWSEKKDVA